MTLNESNNMSKHEMISASPTKNFFVEMLTRDIELEDAILDLLDNCVDGIQRTKNVENTDRVSGEKPYEGFWAKINFSPEYFSLEDNCGGIPIEVARDYAFKMGTPVSSSNRDADVYTIGTYGIGMKRAIFKIGRSSSVLSQTQASCFKVSIDPEWLSSDDSNNSHNWELPLEEIPRSQRGNGTLIEIRDLRDVIKQELSSPQSTLINNLVRKISYHYSYIINKGFEVLVNGTKVSVQPIRFLWDGINNITAQTGGVIAPFLYKAQQDDIDIEIVVGLNRDIASEEEVDDEMEGMRRSSETAGWTIVCNDRVVVYCDKTRLTGWGEAKVPSYHPQFIAISGVVSFRSKNTSKLPLTTTKRGIDSSSEIYLYIKDYMREGLKLFTSYTNRWKINTLEEKERVKKTEPVSASALFQMIPDELWTTVKRRGDSKFLDEKRYIPPLPAPEAQNSLSKPRRINFSRPDSEIRLVAEYLFEDSERSPSEVGDGSFNVVLREANK
jgi:hypothetical protein